MTDLERLADILERIDRIERATADGQEAFLASDVIQDAVIRNLEVIGEAAKAVSPTTRGRVRRVPWGKMARFRDLAIHHYGSILAEEVWKIISTDLAQIRRAIARARPLATAGRSRGKRTS